MPVANLAIASILEEVADRLAIQGANPFRIRAYHNAARLLQGLGDDVKQMVARGDDLTKLPGIGPDLAGKITEIALTGRSALLESLRRQMPPAVTELLKVPARYPDPIRGNCRKEVMMYQHPLVATDGSKLSAKAVAHAIALAKALGARLTAFYASPRYPTPVYAEGYAYVPMPRKEYNALCAKEADKILKPVALEAQQAGLEVQSVHVIADAPWEAILAAARRNKCDAIVMASHGRRGVSALLLGSESKRY